MNNGFEVVYTVVRVLTFSNEALPAFLTLNLDFRAILIEMKLKLLLCHLTSSTFLSQATAFAR